MCLFPQRYEKQEFGRPKPHPEGEMLLPCSKCDECLTTRAQGWALRAQHELHTEKGRGVFLTLTFDEEHKQSEILDKSPFQKFTKNMRDQYGKFTYMASHEYGSQLGRPHHHVLIFGKDFKNYKYLRKSKQGNRLFTSDEVQELWPYGFHSIGEANAKTAYYIASYGLKSRDHEIVTEDGEIIQVKDSMTASKRPAVGRRYFEKYYKRIVKNTQVLPKYYRKLLEQIDPLLFEQYQNELIQSFNPKSVSQRLAKLMIDNQKRNKYNNSIRNNLDANNILDYSRYLKHDLKMYKETLDEKETYLQCS